jgi:hypothetical protein
MVTTAPFKRLILRAVLRQVSPMVIRLLSVPDHMDLPAFHQVIRAILVWDTSKQLESVKHLLWHGNTEEALERLVNLIMDLSLIQARSPAAEKVATGVSDFETYIRNNCEFISNFGERYRQGETISSAFVESTINQVISRRFVKKQQIAWTLRGAHLLLQTRTKVLNNELDDVFRNWYPQFRADAA